MTAELLVAEQNANDMLAVAARVLFCPLCGIRTGTLRIHQPFRMNFDHIVMGSAGNVKNDQSVFKFFTAGYPVVLQNGLRSPEKSVIPCFEIEKFFFRHDNRAPN